MADPSPRSDPLSLDLSTSLWERVLTVAPLVLVGSREPDGSLDFAPKHMAGPAGWGPHFSFVCSPRHATLVNARRTGEFTVSYPRPDQVVATSLAASPRCPDGSKPDLGALATRPADRVDGAFLEGAHLALGCLLIESVDGLGRYGENTLVVGKIVEAWADPRALLDDDVDPSAVLRHCPLLAYLHPGRFARVEEALSFPLPEGFSR